MSEQAVEYLGPLAELREAVSVRTQVAGVLRQLRLENIQNKAIAEDVAASQDFEVDPAQLHHLVKKCTNYFLFLSNSPEKRYWWIQLKNR